MGRTYFSTVVTAMLVTVASSACTSSGEPIASRSEGAHRSPSPTVTIEPSPERKGSPDGSNTESRETNRWVTRRPEWLGRRVLPVGSEGFGEIRPTPPILRNRRLPTMDLFPRPDSHRFTSTVGPVPPDVVARSTWRPRCPVGLDELAYIKMPFWGFDRERHMGEMIVNASVADQIVDVFAALYDARFPIEEMRVVSLKEQREWRTKPTGDTNVTSSFECRRATLGESWSQHSYGLAIDINSFHNPYLRGDLVGPELAGAYTDRTWRRPGMIFEGDVVTRAFDAIGWGWGGRWTSLKDWMHFSQSGT